MTTGLLTTTLGRQLILADLAGGSDLALTHVAFGDAAGAYPFPSDAQTTLVRERYRVGIAGIRVAPGVLYIDAVMPADAPDAQGRLPYGWPISEAGLFDSASRLIAVARMSGVANPNPSTGQASITSFVFGLAVANPSAISVVIDPQAQLLIGRHVRAFWLTVDGVLNAPPADPVTGATYVIGDTPTGAWSGFAHRLAQWVGVWSLATVPVGHVVCDNSKAEGSPDRHMRRTASGWVPFEATQAAFGVSRLATTTEIAERSGNGLVAASSLPDKILQTAIFDVAGTSSWVAPAGVTRVRAQVWAGGGGGGGAAGVAGSVASAGGGGEYREGVFNVTPGTSYNVVVGAGGQFGISTPTNGGAGGTSSFGGFISALGGSGGLAANGGVQGTAGAGGSGGSGGDIVRSGVGGGNAYAIPAGYVLSQGGASFSSNFTSTITTGGIANGAPGQFPGGGASGGALGGSGGTGARGQVILSF
jgi:hypothetical protein